MNVNIFSAKKQIITNESHVMAAFYGKLTIEMLKQSGYTKVDLEDIMVDATGTLIYSFGGIYLNDLFENAITVMETFGKDIEIYVPNEFLPIIVTHVIHDENNNRMYIAIAPRQYEDERVTIAWRHHE